VVPSAVTFTLLIVFGQRRRRVFRVVVFFRRFVVRRFLRFTPALPGVFVAFRFLTRDALASGVALLTGDEDAAMSSSSYNFHRM